MNKEDHCVSPSSILFRCLTLLALFKLLEKIGCLPKQLTVISSFEDNKKGTLNNDGATSEPFEIRNGVKQGCVMAPFLLHILLADTIIRLWLIHRGCLLTHQNIWKAVQCRPLESQVKGTSSPH